MSKYDEQLEKELEKLKKKKKQDLTSGKTSTVVTSTKPLDLYNDFIQNAQTRRTVTVDDDEDDKLISTVRVDDDIAPVKSKDDEDDLFGLDFFQKGAFDDGYQFGDVTKTILGTAGDIGLGAVKGIASLGEGIGDLVNYGIAGVADMAGHDEWADKHRKKTSVNLVENWSKDADDFLDQYSILGRTSDSIMQGVGQVGGIIATGGMGAAAGLSGAGVTALTTGVMGLSGMGSGMGEAYMGGASDEEALAYGAISGAADALSELLFGGLGKAVNAVGFNRGLLGVDDLLAKKVSNMFSSQLAKNIAEFGIKAGAEGFEEVVAGTAQAIGKKLTYMSEEEFSEILEDENLLEQFVVGAVTSGIAQSPSLHIANTSGRDFVTDYSQNEQAVIKKEVENRIAEKEADGTKLTNKEKAAIEAQVEKDMEKGYISTDTIEEVLGGETYQRYKKTIDSENALAEQQKALQEEYDNLNKMKQGEMTGEQVDRRAELKAELADLKETIESQKNHSPKNLLKQRLSESVTEMVRSDRLIESYNERTRKTQAFEADLTKYDTKQRAVVEKAVQSGILNNTNRTHEFVDMVTKISADKGVLFDFTNNEKLKESGFAVDGKAVNGYVTKDGITVNIQSSKALNSIVGHEITHVLEGTDLYTELQNAVVEYAKTKGDFQGRYDSLTKLYENVDGANIDAELTADLVGDYLFTDSDFINNLSTNHRNVFQKIYDEVKYLLKVATAGSKEARELEKVKRAFEKAYRESVQTEVETDEDTFDADDVQYSISVTDKETLDSLNEQVSRGEYDAEKNPDGGYYVTYKSMSFWGYDEDGNAILRSPMAEYVDGELSNAYLIPKDKSKLNWYQATETIDEKTGLPSGLLVGIKEEGKKSKKYVPAAENQDLIAEDWSNLYFMLNKKVFDKKTGKWKNSPVPARYNPYEHSSNSMLNDQFKAAWQRDNLVTVKMYVPVSEDNGAYRAQWSKDPTGWSDWKSGDVATKINKQKDLQRRVYLSRYAAPVEIVPDSEVAQAYKGYLEGTDVAIPDNVVSPNLLAELKKAGVPIVESGNVKYSLSDTQGRQLSNEQAEYFKDSKVVDRKGRLKVVYHGTTAQFNTFKRGDIGYHFGNKTTARNRVGRSKNTRLIESYLNITNPIEFDYDLGSWDADYRLAEELMERGIITQDEYRNVRYSDKGYLRSSGDANKVLRELLLDKGYDGIAYSNTFESNGSTSYIAFKPEQIKLTANENPTDNPDIRYSLSDSEGRQLSSEQQEYFKDSVVRDENGNLKVMYHGTSKGGFNVFDTYGSNYGLFGTGSYFTDSKTIGESYTKKGKGKNPQVYEAYLNIKNPMDMDAPANPSEWVKAFPDADFPEAGTNEQFYRAVEEFYADQWMSKWEVAEEIQSAIESGMGYDGITHIGGGRVNPNGEKHRVYIAFQPEQIKNVDNAKPTGNPDIRYSLSEDSNGKKLSPAVQKRFSNSKAVDENGNLLVLYHGTASGEFSIFDKSKGNVEGDFGSGFYFTNDDYDVEENYEGGGPDFDNKVARLAEQIEQEEDIDYEEAEERARAELYKGGHKFEVYLNIEKPAVVGETILFDSESYLEEYNEEDYDDYDEYIGDVEQLLSDDIENIVWEVEKNVDVYSTDGLADVLYNAYYEGGIGIEELKKKINDLYLEDSNGNLVGNEVTRQIIESLGYDGIIDPTVSSKFNMGLEESTTHYIVFKPNQIKAITNENPTDHPDIRYSLSEDGHPVTEDMGSEVQFSLSKDTEYMDKAIAKNNSSMMVDSAAMSDAQGIRARIAERMNAIKDKGLVGLPEDIEGNTYIANSSYDGTEENTTICPRSLASEAFVDAVSEYLGRPLTVEEQIYISQDLQGRSLTPECTYCYVATDRKAYRAFLGEYVNQRDAVLQKLQNNPNADTSRSGELYKEFLNGRKDTNPMYNRFNMWVKAYQNGTPMMDASHLANINKLMGDINSEFGAELKPQIVDAMKYAQSASWAKKRVNYVAYNGHILNWKQDRINKLNSHYGLRMYSFSDFHPAFVLENMQMITDASVRGLKMLGYTKDTDFVEIFAPSGMNINVSTFGFESGGNVYENNIIGANWEQAKALRAQYPNVGITFVATNDTLVNWALDQDWIDVVIPYHLVRTGAEVAKAFNYTNYTSESSDTKDAGWKNGADKKYIAPTEHNNDKATYLAALKANHLKPRFERFINNPNYMKLVNECRRPASESKPVQPVFNEDAAMTALAKLEANGYYQPIGGSVDRMYEIAAEVAEQIAPAQNSLSWEGEKPKQYGKYNVYGKDIALETAEEVAPVAKNATTEATVAENATVEDLFPDDLAPVQEEIDNLLVQQADIRGAMEAMVAIGDYDGANNLLPEYEEVTARINELEQPEAERVASLDDADVPPELDAPYQGEESDAVENPFEDRDWYKVGNPKVKAYMYENPEVKPFFQEEALALMSEWRDTTRGERFYNDNAYLNGGNEDAWTGVSRNTSKSMEILLDSWHMSYDDIEKGLNAIIEDNGAENIAAAKKIEFMLNDRLLNGYTDFYTKRAVPPNQDYINLLNEKQINEYSKEAFDRFMATADQYAPEEIAPVAQEVAQDVAPTREYEAIRPQRRKEPKMVRADSFTPEQQKIAEILDSEPTPETKKSRAWAIFKANVLDKGAVFEDLSLKRRNRELMGKWNFTLSSEARAQHLMGSGADGVMSLNDIREEVGNTGLTHEFTDYLYHKHNVDRMQLADRFEDTPNKPVFGDSVTAEVSKRITRRYENEHPEFKDFANDVYNYMSHLRQLMVDNGVISEETARLWRRMYPHYVPIRRVNDTGFNIDVPLDTGRTTVNAPVKRATGGNSDILPLFDTMAQRTLQTYKAIAKNSFGVELKNTLGTTIENNQTDLDEVIDSIDAQEGLLQEGKNGRNPTFTVFENGEKVTFEITQDMYDALKPMSEGMKYTNKFLNTASNLHRGVLTEYNPVFMLTNAIKDTQDVLINSQHPLKTYSKIPEAHAQILKKGYWYQEYMANGGEQNTYFDNETASFDTEHKGLEKLLDVPPLSTISKLNNTIEMLPRLSEYIASREAGRSVEVSMLDAARVTTNFSAGGNLTKLLNRNGATFLNASVQGFMQNVRNVREAKANGMKGWVNLATKFAMAGLPALILNNLVWDDDDEYEELSDYVKQSYYIVGKTEDGKFIRIPKGRTLAVIQNAFDMVSDALTGDDEVDLNRFLELGSLAISNLAPNNPLDNNILAPITQVLTNTTWYGEDLVPTRLQDLPAAQQYDESTDAFSKWLGEKLNISPVKINYLLDQYSGGLGDSFLPMLTPEAESGDNTLLGNILAPLKSKFTTDSVMNNQNVADFYDTKDELSTNAKASVATDEDVLMSKYMNSINAELSNLYAQKRDIQNSDLPDDVKYEQVREVQKQIVALTKEGLNTYEDISYEGDYARIGDRVFQKNDEGEWQKLSSEQLTKYEVTKAAGDAKYASDGTNHYRWYEPSEDAGDDVEAGWRKVSEKELERQNEVTSGLGISPEEYWGNKDEYSYAYDHPENYAVAKAVGGYEAFKQYSSELYDIKADKDSNGKSISGSRKEKVQDYINNLDADYGEKIILFKSEYPADDTYNYEIIDYLNSREDISYEEMNTILKKLGFTIEADGVTITWD